MQEIPRTPKGGYGQNWPAYDAAQTNEKIHFLRILFELCKEVEELEHLIGRTPFLLREMIFCLVYKVYSQRSARRVICDLREVKAKTLIGSVPSPTSLSEYMRRDSLTPILQNLLAKSSLPMAEVETVFAVDSTGLSIPGKRTYFDRHSNRRKRRRDYAKLHAMIGVETNIITYAEVTEGTASDIVNLKQLVEGTSRYFKISEVSADAGYPSGENVRAILLAGGIPYIAFRKNNTLDADYKSTAWKDLLHLYKRRDPKYMEHYNRRNNVEATFHALKSKFGDRLRSKSFRGQINEALCKSLCHNLCVLIHSFYELGIDPTSWSQAKLTPKAEAGLIGTAFTATEAKLARERLPAAPEPSVTPRHRNRKRWRYNDPSQTSLFG
jgi:transposase